ncbi:MAG TPA: nitrate reductase molybdenum cofactor assembly chaperone [Casimicrobiaceae bacterium]|nr:nitrate reductase molybdenum cofactor assembly chaperone [Casimicrobiaceae bacterium]
MRTTTHRGYKALGALLGYPSPELIAALPEISAALGSERRFCRATRAGLAALVAELGRGDPIGVQERYVETFDRGRRTSLHLFEHVHGESRGRGQAMVDLRTAYAREGFVLAANELPDYLPVLLEFVAERPEAGREMLADCAHIVRGIGEALRDRGSGYAAVLAGILDLAGERGLGIPSAAPPAEREKSLDEEWAEEPVFFGPPNGRGCGTGAPASSVVRVVPRRA